MKNRKIIGMDLGDKKHHLCVMDGKGAAIEETTVTNRPESLRKYFDGCQPATVVVEAGTHSPWISRLLGELGHEVLVANPRKLRAIWQSERKDDRRDAQMLARIGRFDRELLYPITHRSAAAQADLALIKARDSLVSCRRSLINHLRGSVKAWGERLPACSADSFAKRVKDLLPEALQPALQPVLEQIAELTKAILSYERQLESLCHDHYPETQRLRQITGVGPITSLAFILTLEEAGRFTHSRSVGAFLGLTPGRDQSGECDRQRPITKAGNEDLRRLLVGSAQYIMGPFGPSCALRRFGLQLAARGGKGAKKRAIVAVARKLAVLLHHLWQSGEDYLPEGKALPTTRRRAAA